MPTLLIGDLHYPVYQFFLADNPADGCGFPHWHSFGPVFSLETPTAPLDEPHVACGFGVYTTIPLVYVDVPFLEWDAYLLLHPPQV